MGKLVREPNLDKLIVDCALVTHCFDEVADDDIGDCDVSMDLVDSLPAVIDDFLAFILKTMV